MSVSKLAPFIDHTLLKPTASHIEIKKICDEAVEFGFAAVCVPPPFVRTAVQELGGRNGVKVATVIGFPFGYSVSAAKAVETEQALADGADELDVVINLIALKAGDWDLLQREMRLLTERVHEAWKIVKVIIETGILTEE